MSVAANGIRTQFFDLLFGTSVGYLCIASRNPNQPRGSFTERFFEYPAQLAQADEYIENVSRTHDCYFCVNLLSQTKRTKSNCLPSDLVWADLDTASPDSMDIAPAIILQTSPGRYQGIWRLTMTVDPFIAEGYSKRIAYAYSDMGADKSGWDLTQLLRVPLTHNFKYETPFLINLDRALSTKVQPLLFDSLPQITTNGNAPQVALPAEDDLPPLEQIYYKYKSKLLIIKALVDQEPGESDWSTLLWKLIHTCIEIGMDNEEVLVICRNSNCNKYDRDNRPATDLWRDITKARDKSEQIALTIGTYKPLTMPILVSSADSDEVDTDNFVTQYFEWGIEATDAVEEYHNLSAFMLLSAIVANSVRLETSYGSLVPNLWGLLLGDSTLTRKTTSQRMVMDILQTIDQECIIATDGSAEGLLTALEQRPNKTSVFFKDEVSGFFDSINRKDYLAGMTETLTALYDVPSIFSRRLRKETITIESPAFIFFGGGVKNKVFDVIPEGYILSGFLPRFLVVSGSADLDRIRRTGPNTQIGEIRRTNIMNKAADLKECYGTEITQKVFGQTMSMPLRIKAILSEDAWSTYGEIEEKMIKYGMSSSIPDLALPTFERLSRSLLKMSLLLAAARQTPQEDLLPVERRDVVTAATYVERWGWDSIELISAAGKGIVEKLIDRVMGGIERQPGIRRSDLMQHFHMTKKDADLILGTLEERMLVRKEGSGRGYRYWLAS